MIPIIKPLILPIAKIVLREAAAAAVTTLSATVVKLLQAGDNKPGKRK